MSSSVSTALAVKTLLQYNSTFGGLWRYFITYMYVVVPGLGVLTGVKSDSFAKSVFFQSLIESWEIIETSVED